MNNNLFGLTERELVVLTYSLKGKSNRDIAEKLFVTLSSIKAHIHNLLEKTNTKTKQELIAKFYCMLLNTKIDDIDVLIEKFVHKN